ncbi:MAG: HD domain-containing protein [Patescibacteria group bacterium]
MSKLDKLIKFSKLLNDFRKVERALRVHGEDRRENDVEHSYQLAMLAWFLAVETSADLDINLVIKYAMVHDLVEVYAGDTYAYTTDKSERESKEKREKDAAVRLRKEFPEFEELHSLILRYNERGDNESRFVYALDKVHATLNIYTDGGRTWREKGITIDMIVGYKKDKIALSPEIKIYFDELIELLTREENKLF